jgi:hypothetical protein
MKLWIGNATKQVYDFRYRKIGKAAAGGKPLAAGQLMQQKIQVGAQTALSGDLTRQDIDYIVSQHAKYGLICESEIDQTRAFHGTCYSIDAPISRTRLVYLIEGNMRNLVAQGEEIRRVNAVAHNNLINGTLQEAGQPPIDVLEMTIQQENADPANDVPQMSEGVLVSADADARPLSGRGRRAAR